MWSFIIFIIDAIRLNLGLESVCLRSWFQSDSPALPGEDASSVLCTDTVSNGGFMSDPHRVFFVFFCINFSLSNARARRPSHGYCTAMVAQVDEEDPGSRSSTS